jgi:copper(I)-binding protein
MNATQALKKAPMKTSWHRWFGITLLALSTSTAHAQVTVKDAWIRGTVAQQKATGLFAQITSATAARLLSASSPVAGVVEIHEMAMDGNVMRMRAVPGLDLPAGRMVELKPGGFHVMLMDLKQPLKDGETVPVLFVVEAGGQRQTIEVQAPVRPLAARAGEHHHHHHQHQQKN